MANFVSFNDLILTLLWFLCLIASFSLSLIFMLSRVFSARKTKNITRSEFQQLAENERSIDEFENNMAQFMENPIKLDGIEKLYCPNLTVAGMKSKTFKAKGSGTTISLSKLTGSSLLSLFQFRKYFRIAYLRVVWIPCAVDLPGSVSVSLRDYRARPERNIVAEKEMPADKMFRFTHMNNVFTHKQDIDKFGIEVNLKGYEEKYPNGGYLGVVRIYWFFQTTNNVVQFNPANPIAEEISRFEMPNISNLTIKNRETLKLTDGNYEDQVKMKSTRENDEHGLQIDIDKITAEVSNRITEKFNKKDDIVHFEIRPKINFNADSPGQSSVMYPPGTDL